MEFSKPTFISALAALFVFALLMYAYNYFMAPTAKAVAAKPATTTTAA